MYNVGEIIRKLPKYVRVTGSHARGGATIFSDYDFFVPEKKWGSFKKWASGAFSMQPTSCAPMTLTWNLGDNHNEQLEFSVLFDKQPTRLQEVELFDRTFKTH